MYNDGPKAGLHTGWKLESHFTEETVDCWGGAGAVQGQREEGRQGLDWARPQTFIQSHLSVPLHTRPGSSGVGVGVGKDRSGPAVSPYFLQVPGHS